jgi:hypothetical protein
MASRKRRTNHQEEYIGGLGGLIRPKREDVAEPHICVLPIEGISFTLDPNRALLRRVFFLNEDRNKYISVAFYPQQGYSVLVELGAAKSIPLRLTTQQFTTLTEHLPGLIQALCAGEYYISGVHDNFGVVTEGSYQTSWFHLGFGKNKNEFVLKLQEVLHLNNIRYLVANQLNRYSGPMEDAMNYSAAAMPSSNYRTTAPLQ